MAAAKSELAALTAKRDAKQAENPRCNRETELMSDRSTSSTYSKLESATWKQRSTTRRLGFRRSRFLRVRIGQVWVGTPASQCVWCRRVSQAGRETHLPKLLLARREIEGYHREDAMLHGDALGRMLALSTLGVLMMKSILRYSMLGLSFIFLLTCGLRIQKYSPQHDQLSCEICTGRANELGKAWATDTDRF